MSETPAPCIDCHPGEVTQKTSSQPETTTARDAHNPLDPTTFVPPSHSITPSVTIEFCDRCRWLHRATWVSTELFLTFPAPAIRSINLMPLNAEDTAGRFRVWLYIDDQPHLVWDRKVEAGFPELKVLKQRIRDHIQPGKSLGHSDK